MPSHCLRPTVGGACSACPLGPPVSVSGAAGAEPGTGVRARVAPSARAAALDVLATEKPIRVPAAQWLSSVERSTYGWALACETVGHFVIIKGISCYQKGAA